VPPLFDRRKEALAEGRLAADDLHTDFRVWDAPGGNPIEATPGTHLEPQLAHVRGDFDDAMQNVILDNRVGQSNVLLLNPETDRFTSISVAPIGSIRGTLTNRFQNQGRPKLRLRRTPVPLTPLRAFDVLRAQPRWEVSCSSVAPATPLPTMIEKSDSSNSIR
jgi:hypothetical protein